MSDGQKATLQRWGIIISAIGAIGMPFVLFGLNLTYDKVNGIDERQTKTESHLSEIDKRIAVIEETRFKSEDGERIKTRSDTIDEDHNRRLMAVEHMLTTLPANLIDRLARVEEKLDRVGDDVQKIKERSP